jgi:hypothetical protein
MSIFYEGLNFFASGRIFLVDLAVKFFLELATLIASYDFQLLDVRLVAVFCLDPTFQNVRIRILAYINVRQLFPTSNVCTKTAYKIYLRAKS